MNDDELHHDDDIQDLHDDGVARVAEGPERVAVFDLPSLFWTVAKAREGRDKDPQGAALAALRHARDLCGKVGCGRAVFASERKPYWRQSAGVQGVKCQGLALTQPLIPYKVGRAAKSEALVCELGVLEAALIAGGFEVLAVEEGRPFDPEEPWGGQGSSGPRACWFEADDVAASLAQKLVEQGAQSILMSNDWDLAGAIPDHGAPGDPSSWDAPRIFLRRISGEEKWVTPSDVQRNFGVPPSRLWEYLALAGDGDFKPYPGALKAGVGSARKRAPGIGEQGAKEVLALFGGFDAAVLQALSAEPPSTLMPAVRRALALIRAGGLERARCTKQLAQLRFDVPVPASVIEGALRGGAQDWEKAEAMLKRTPYKQADFFTPDECEAIAFVKGGGLRERREEVIAILEGRPCPLGKCDHALGEHAGPSGAKGCTVEGCPCVDVDNPLVSRAPVCPRCLGVEPGKAAGDPEDPHPGPFTAELCAPCANQPLPSADRPCAGGPACKPQYDELGIFEVSDAERAGMREQHRRELRKHVSEAEVDELCPPVDAGAAVTGREGERIASAIKRGARAQEVLLDALEAAHRRSPESHARLCAAVELLAANHDRALNSPTDLGKLSATLHEYAAEDAARLTGEVEREAQEIDDALAPKVRVVLTRAEFWALAPLVAAHATQLIGEVDLGVVAVISAVRSGAFEPLKCGHALTALLSPTAEAALDRLAEVAVCAEVGRDPEGGATASEMAIAATPGFLAFARYGAQLVRA